MCGWWVSPATIERSLAGDVGVVVEAEHGVGLGQRLGQVLAVALGQAADGDHGLRAPARRSLRSAASSRVSTESFLAASTKPQVLTTTVSASSGSSTSRKPPASSRPASSSESTSLRAQPRVTRATVVDEASGLVRMTADVFMGASSSMTDAPTASPNQPVVRGLPQPTGVADRARAACRGTPPSPRRRCWPVTSNGGQTDHLLALPLGELPAPTGCRAVTVAHDDLRARDRRPRPRSGASVIGRAARDRPRLVEPGRSRRRWAPG